MTLIEQTVKKLSQRIQENYEPKLDKDALWRVEQDFTALLTQYTEEVKKEMEYAPNYLLNLEIPECDASIDFEMKTTIFARKTEDKVQAEIITSKLKYWTKVWTYKLKHELQKQIDEARAGLSHGEKET